MFHLIEKYRKPSQFLLGCIALSFVGFSAVSLTSLGSGNYIVQIGEKTITREDLDRALHNTRNSGGSGSREEVFQALLNQAYLLEGAKKMGVAVSDEQIKQMIVDDPNFHDQNGDFSPQIFRNFLQSNRMSEEQYTDRLRDQYLTFALQKIFANGSIPDTQVAQFARSVAAARTIRLAVADENAFADKVTVNDAELQKFYRANQKAYRQQQAVKYQYLLLSPKILAERESVSDAEIDEIFKQQQDKLKPTRRVSMIMVPIPVKGGDAAKAAARAEAEAAAQAAKAAPEQFAAIAQRFSKDGSAAKGGDIGDISQNGTLEKPLEDAVFALNKGEVSALIEGSFGYYVFQVNDILDNSPAAVKQRIAQDLKEKKAAQSLKKLREDLGDYVINNSSELESAAKKFGVPLQSGGDWLTRAGAAEQKLPEAVIEALFGSDVFDKKHNSDPISAADGSVWVLRASETRPEAQLSFEQAKEQVKADYIRSESRRLATEHNKKLLAELQAGKEPALNWTNPQPVMPEQLRGMMPPADYLAIMKAQPKDGKPAYALLQGTGMPQLVEVQSLSEVKPNAEERAAIKQQLAVIQGNTLIEAYLQKLRQEIPAKQGRQKLEDQ